MNWMNTNHLKYFFDAATEQSIGRASKLNYVSQSAISQAIRKLEDNLEVELLVHQRNRFKLTEEGQILLEKCRGIFSTLENVRNELKESKKEISGSLLFATSHSIALSKLPSYLENFGKKYPKIIPKFRLGKTPIVKSWLQEDAIEFAITVDDGSLSAFEKQVISTGSFCVIKSKSRNKQLRDRGFLVTEENSSKNSLRPPRL